MAITVIQLSKYRNTRERLEVEIAHAQQVFRETTNILLDKDSAEMLVVAAWKAERGITGS